MGKGLASSVGILFVCLAGCGGVSSNGDGGASGAHATGGAGAGGSGGAGAAGTGAAGAGTAGSGSSGVDGGAGNRPCIDTVCAGACVGGVCDIPWTCVTMVACSADATQYCGCDGTTFTAGSCAPRAYRSRGPCAPGVSCDEKKVLCKIARPDCPANQVPSVEGNCYGPCVPYGMCACTGPSDCPSPSTLLCDTNTMRCALFIE